LSGWVLATSIPRHVLFAPAIYSLYRVLALGAGTLLLAGLVGRTIDRTTARPVSGLSRLTSEPGGVEGADRPPSTHIREVDAVAESLQQQMEQRSHAATALRTEAESRRRIERQLVHSQKMEAIGQLTGSST
jgi:hypothetical protein